MDIASFNRLTTEAAYDMLMACCHCHRWAQTVTSKRPFEAYDTLLNSALDTWATMQEPEWLEAFGHHAKIGDVNALKDKFSKANKEQGQISVASDAVIEALFEANQTYEAQNGFIFIVCATGKSAEEMLSILQTRLNNARDVELNIAAQEQAKILTIRLENQFLSEC